MLKRIYADNYRCLVNFEFRPEKINLLVGANSSGKTSVVRLLENVRDFVVNGAKAQDLFALARTRWEARQVQRVELDLERDGTYKYALELKNIGSPIGTVTVESETVYFQGGPLFEYRGGTVRLYDDEHKLTATFPFRSDLSYLSNIDARPLRLAAFRAWLQAIWSFRLNPFAASVASAQGSQVLASDGSNFPSWFRYLNESVPEAREALQERLRQVIPDFRRFRFEPTGPEPKLLSASFADKSQAEYTVFFTELSEGIKVLAALYSILFGLPNASLICVDEPENFVAHAEIQPWLQEFHDRLDERGTQALIISHHPEVIDYLATGDVFKFDRPTGDVVRCEKVEFDRSKGLTASEQMFADA